MADQAGEADRAAVHQRDAPAPAVDAEHRVLGGDAQVAPDRQLEPAGDRVALDRGDHRLAEQHPRRPDRPVAVGLDPAARGAARLAHRLEVGAGAELAARAGQHRDGQRVVGVEAPERVGQRVRGRAVDRVRHLGPVDRHDATGPSTS